MTFIDAFKKYKERIETLDYNKEAIDFETIERLKKERNEVERKARQLFNY